MDPPQTPRPDDSGGRVSMVKQNPQGFQIRPQGPPGSPRYPINNGSIGGQRLAGQPPPNLNRLDSRASLRSTPSSPNQFGPQQLFGPRPTSTGAPGNFPRAPPVYPGNQLNQGPPRFPTQGTPGAARGPPYPPPPGQRLPFNQSSQGIRPRPPGPPYNADIRQPLPRNIPGNYGTGVPRNEPIGRSETPVALPRMNSEKSPPIQQEKMNNDTEIGKNDDPVLLKKKLASRNGNGDDDDDDDDVVMDTEQQAKSPTPKIMSPEVQKTPSPTVLEAENVSSTPSPEPKNVDGNVKNTPTPQMSESTTPVPEAPERPVSRIEPSKTPEVEVKGDHAVETESSTNASRPASVKSMKSPPPDDKTPELLAASSDIRSSTSSPSPNILGFDDGNPRSLSPKSPVPHSPSPATSPLVSSTPKSPGTPKSDTEKKKTTFADEIEDRDDAKDDNINEKPQSRSETPVKEKPGTRPVTPAAEKLPSRPGTSILSRPATPAASEKSRPATPAEKTQTRPGTPAASIIAQKPDPPTLTVDPKSPIQRSTSGRSIKSDAGENGVNQANAQPTTNGVAVSPTKKVASKSREGDKSKPAASPVKSPSKSIKSLPRTPEAGPPSTEKKKVPMNKIQVGAAPSPNLKTVRSKIGSLENTSYKPGGGKVKIENRKLDFSNAQPKIAAKNEKYTPSGGDKKITQVKLQWNAKPKVGSLENATYKPGGGDKKIETVKLDFKDKAKPKVGSKDNAKHVPGGGTIKSTATPPKTPQDLPDNIETQKIDVKAESKVGSLDNVKYKPGGGDKKIFDDKTYLRQMSPNVQSVNGSGTQETDDSNGINEIQDPNPPPSTPTKSRPSSIASPVTPEAVKSNLQARTPDTPKKVIITESKHSRPSTATLQKVSPNNTPTPRTRSPKSPLTPKSPTTPKSPLTPKSPTTPKSPLTPKSPTTPKSPLTSKSPTTPKSPLTSKSPTTPKSPLTPKSPTTPKSPLTSKSPTTSRSPSTPKSPEKSPRPPSSLDIKSSDKSSASSSRKSSPKGFLFPKITSPIQSEIISEPRNYESSVKLPKLIETSTVAARAGLT